ncbi:ribosome maturation factor RimP [Streptomyces sp. 6N223]|uniref:ribosome maturation factor RimP n=1 Tax=Streptomyces sp. 6N223 TaxID=3457412 RepID=UPI003FD56581
MSTTQIDRLRELLGPLAAQRGLDLEEIAITPAGKRRVLRVVVDSDDGVGLEACAELSRAVSQALDSSDAMGGAPYVLEVSSPGAERPLTAPRHYRRATGRLIRAHLHEGGELTARILTADEDGVEVEVPGPKGRSTDGRPGTARRVAFADIARARVEVEFSRKAGAAGPGSGAAIPDESQKEA